MRWLRQLAFVQLVTGKREQADEPATCPEQISTEAPVAPTETPDVQAASPIASKLKPPIVSSELRAEVQARILSFRAHQERFSSERERHFSDTLEKLRAKMQPASPPRS